MRARHSSLWLGGALASFALSAAVLSLFWAPYNPEMQNIAGQLQAPSLTHWFGTDHLGRDTLSMTLAGARNSITVALVAVMIGMGVGVPLGLFAAAQRGWVDSLLMRINDLLFAFPALILAILITAIFGPGAINAIIAIGVFNIPVFARLTRGAALSIWAHDYILAARLSGKTALRISWEHILPNLAGLLIVQGSIQFAMGIIAEAGLSYLGLGAQPPASSWGRMLFDAQTMTGFAPWLAIFPGLAILLSVLGFNLLGDGLRDVLDPRQKGHRE